MGRACRIARGSVMPNPLLQRTLNVRFYLPPQTAPGRILPDGEERNRPHWSHCYDDGHRPKAPYHCARPRQAATHLEPSPHICNGQQWKIKPNWPLVLIQQAPAAIKSVVFLPKTCSTLVLLATAAMARSVAAGHVAMLCTATKRPTAKRWACWVCCRAGRLR